jgi:RHS repeat-associated protein
MKFNLPTLLNNQVITYAHVEFIKTAVAQNNFQLNIFKNTLDFNVTSVTWSNSNGGQIYNPNEVVDYYSYSTGNTRMIFDVTKTIKEWQAGISPNYGFTLAAKTLSGEYKDLYQNDSSTSNRPVIRIGFENPSGLKDYWTYTSQDLGQVGMGYISDYTGNLTFVRNEYQLNNQFLPLSLSFYFNNATRTQNIGYGNGWKTNFNMKVEYDSSAQHYFLSKPDGGKTYFIPTNWTNEDGYDHFSYILEDGSKVKLEMVYWNFQIFSTKLKTLNQMVYDFDTLGRLFQITNEKNNHKIFVYYNGTSDRISYVSDAVSNRIDFTYTLYGSNHLLTKTELKLKQPGSTILNTAGDKSYFYYTQSTNPRLYSITQRFNYSGSQTPSFSSGDTLRYTFDATTNRLINAYNSTSNHRVEYTYNTNHQVNQVNIRNTTSPTSNLLSLNVLYEHGKTTYINHKNEWVEYLFDQYGHTVNALDSYGNATYRKYAGLFTYHYEYNNDLGDSPVISNSPNYFLVHSLLESSKIIRQQVNHINNHGFENLESNLRWYKIGNGIIQKDTNEYSMGSASLRVANYGITYAYQDLLLKPGVYTLSGFVKNSNEAVSGVSSISIDTNMGTLSSSSSDVGLWKHLSVQFEITTTQTVRVKLTNDRFDTNSYFDNVSLTEGFMDTRFNMLSNSSFEEGSGNWTLNGAILVNDNSSTGANQDILGIKSIRIDGDTASEKYFYQEISSHIPKGETFVVGAWAKANAVPNKTYINSNGENVSDNRFFGVIIEFTYVIGGTKKVYLPFDTSTEQWQYQMRSIEIDKDVVSIKVYGKYQGEGVAYFDNIQLYHDKLSVKYDYDLTNGHLKKKYNIDGTITAYDRDSGGNIISITDGNRSIEINHHNNLISDIVVENVKTAFTYHSTSKQIIETLIGDHGTNGQWFKLNTSYTSDYQYIASQTDEFGSTTISETNHINGLLKTIINANDHLKSYDYNNYGFLIKQVETDISNQYTIVKNFTYDSKRRISGISIDGVSYTFVYDNLDRITNVKISGVDYVTLTYVTEEHGSINYFTNKVNTQTYGTGDTFTFEYTKENQVKKIKFNNEDRYEYVYDQSGRLAVYKELQSNNIFFYSYDLTGRIKQVVDKHGNKIKFTYDKEGNISKYTYEVEQVEREVYYFYDETTGEYFYTFYETGNEIVSKINHIDTTDSLRRLAYIELLIGTLSFTEHFTYKTPVAGRGNASFIIASISYKIDGNIQYTHHFTYDALGNITEISVTNASSTEIENYQYVYDGFNRLIRENIKTTDYEQTILYTYDDYSDDTIPYVDSNSNDNRGNITSIKRYAYTLDAEPSGTPLSETRLFYKTTGWKDQITRIEEHVGGTLQKTSTYVYDSIGNLLSITSDTNQSFTWEGRRLVGHTIGSVTYTYTYNDQGVRTSKFNGTNITEYFLDGSLVLFEKTGNDVIYYTYDVDDSLLSMNYNGNEYFYIKNLQGDIIEIVDASGYTVARYRYDAWGNIVYQEDSGLGIANINPYRYRSYRYDTETGLYYLNTRYYDPSIGRFISADSINFLDPSNTQGLNLYAYCGNNPVMYIDRDGNFPVLISLLAIAVATYMTYGAVKSYNTSKDLGYSGWDLAGYTASGLIAGDYFVVRDNWDSISQNIIPGYNATDDPYINFDFTKNKYYSIFTAGLYAKHLYSNYYVEGRTVLGMYIELQVHYVFDKVARPFGITNGNPAWLGAPDLNGDWTAWIFEGFARCLKPIPPIMPRIYW